MVHFIPGRLKRMTQNYIHTIKRTLVLISCCMALVLFDVHRVWSAPPNPDEMRFLNHVLKIVKTNYVRDVNESELLQYAVEGLVKSVDPYAAYLTQDVLPEYEKRVIQPFGPLGLALAMDEGVLTIMSVADDSPAYKAGLEPKDKIVKIDGQSTRGITLMDGWKKLKGPNGSKVSINVVKNKTHKLKTYSVKRESYFVQPIISKNLDQSHLYVKISDFQEDTEASLKKIIDKANLNGRLQGIVLDLRNNPGGLLDRSLKTVNLFTDKSPLCITEKRNTKKEEMLASKNMKPYPFNLAVLINEGTSGGSEVFAGAMQDHDRALLFGSPSFGKASIENLIHLSNGATINLTTAYIQTPKGKNIFKNGITPDIEVKNSDDGNGSAISNKSTKAIEHKSTDPQKDPLVKSALEWLKSGKRVAESRPEKQQ